jgi:phage/plasmid-associated DNA primase
VLGPNEFYKNIYLSQEFPNWAPYFFAILTQFYKVYAKDGLIMPPVVKADTESYRRDCDAYAMFIEDYIEKSENGVLYLEDTYYAFKDWYAGEFNTKPPARREFKPYMDKKLRQKYNTDGKTGWKGYTLKIQPERPVDVGIEEFGNCL